MDWHNVPNDRYTHAKELPDGSLKFPYRHRAILTAPPGCWTRSVWGGWLVLHRVLDALNAKRRDE